MKCFNMLFSKEVFMEQFLLDFMSEYADFGIILVNIIVMKKFPFWVLYI